MPLPPTDRRLAILLLLRDPVTNLPGSRVRVREGSRRMIEGYELVIVGAAKQDEWPNVVVLAGDVSAMTWAMERHVQQAMQNLAASPQIIAARVVGA